MSKNEGPKKSVREMPGGGGARTGRALSFYARARTLTAPFPKFYQAPWQSGAGQSSRLSGAAGAKKRIKKDSHLA